MKKTLWAVPVCSLMTAMPVSAGAPAAIANDPSGVFVEFVTTSSGATAITAVDVGTAATAEVTSTTTTSEIGAVVQAISLDLSISPPQAQFMISLIDALPVGQVPASVATLRAQLVAKLAEG